MATLKYGYALSREKRGIAGSKVIALTHSQCMMKEEFTPTFYKIYKADLLRRTQCPEKTF